MSRLTDWGENRLADFIRGQGSAWLPSSWWMALASVADDGTVTELAGSGYARVEVPRSLLNFAGTQGDGTTSVSSGTSHRTSNNLPIDYGTAGAAWGTANAMVMYTASSGGNAFAVSPFEDPLVIGNGDPVSIAESVSQWTLGLSGGMSDYLANKLIDLVWRAQAYSFPANVYVGLLTAEPSNAGGGTEVSGGSYARVAIASSAAAWRSTQGNTDAASTGTGGRIDNVSAVTFPSPTALWGVAGWMKLRDAASAGNLLFWRALTVAKTVSAGGAPPYFPAGDIGITFQ